MTARVAGIWAALDVVVLSLAGAPVSDEAEITVLRDLRFLGDGRAERLDVYQPTRGDGLRPAVVYFHRGGWVQGDKAAEREENIGTHLATVGYVFVSANYALGENAWPQNLQDCRDAVRSLRAHAAEHQVDPQRIWRCWSG